MTNPNSQLNLMAGSIVDLAEEDPQEQLFVAKIQVKQTLVDAIVDSESPKNLITEGLV